MINVPRQVRHDLETVPDMHTSWPDRLIMIGMVLIVLGLVGVAGFTSFHHGLETLRIYGAEDPGIRRYFVLSVDGMAISCGLVVLWAARNKVKPTWLARCGLGIGIAATVTSNALHSLSYGYVAAAISAWPAIALLTAYELLMWCIRTARALADQRHANQLTSEQTLKVDAAPDGSQRSYLMAQGDTPTTGTPVVSPAPVTGVPEPPRLTPKIAKTVKPQKATPVKPPPPRQPRGQGDEVLAKARALLDEFPHMSGAELGRQLRVSERHGLRLSKAVRESGIGTHDR